MNDNIQIFEKWKYHEENEEKIDLTNVNNWNKIKYNNIRKIEYIGMRKGHINEFINLISKNNIYLFSNNKLDYKLIPQEIYNNKYIIFLKNNKLIKYQKIIEKEGFENINNWNKLTEGRLESWFKMSKEDILKFKIGYKKYFNKEFKDYNWEKINNINYYNYISNYR